MRYRYEHWDFRCEFRKLEQMITVVIKITKSQGSKKIVTFFSTFCLRLRALSECAIWTNANGCHRLQDFSRAQATAMPFSHTVEWSRMDGRNELSRQNRSTFKKSFLKTIKNSSHNRFLKMDIEMMSTMDLR